MTESTHNSIELLIVDDDDELRDTTSRMFTRRGFATSDAANGEDALELANRRAFAVAVFDLMMPGMSGLELLERFQQVHPDCEVILLTGRGAIETVVQAMKLGAFDFLTKPFPLKDLETLIRKANERRLLRKENQQLKTWLARTQPKSEMIGRSPAMRELFRLIERAAPSDKAILIQGESGAGKELAARALHRGSRRAGSPLVTINCAALPETLLESELFGHEKGAFTGAVAAKEGLFEVADSGALFIDEIGEMPTLLQAKLLRVLENGSMRRVGSLKERRVDVRLLAATNRDMAQEVEAGRFREDLFYRINVMSLELPPLRRRVGDLPLLVSHFLGDLWSIVPEAVSVLEQYHWPGNIRQLANVIERAKILADNHTIRLQDLPKEITASTARAADILNADDLSAIERAKVVEILHRENGNKTRAAAVLGIDRRKLYRLLKKYAIEDGEHH